MSSGKKMRLNFEVTRDLKKRKRATGLSWPQCLKLGIETKERELGIQPVEQGKKAAA